MATPTTLKDVGRPIPFRAIRPVDDPRVFAIGGTGPRHVGEFAEAGSVRLSAAVEVENGVVGGRMGQ